MALSYHFDQANHLLHIISDGPSSIDDYESAAPRMLHDVATEQSILLLIEVRGFTADDAPERHDLGFFFLNAIKEKVSKCAIVCPKEEYFSIAEHLELIRNHGGDATTFVEVAPARDWLLN